MEKIWLIIQREYLSRVMTKKFWILTFVVPFSIMLLYGFLGYILSNKGDSSINVVVVDKNNILGKRLPNSESIYYHYPKGVNIDELKEKINKEEKYDAILYLEDSVKVYSSNHSFDYYANKTFSLDKEIELKSILSKRIRQYKIKQFGLEQKQLSALDAGVKLKPQIIGEEENSVSNLASTMGASIGILIGFAMYGIIFIYGNMVMRSVMEEKVNRIVEVMISTVKPFQLMLGKVLGVACVGITQILAWALTLPFVGLIGSTLLSSSNILELDPSALEAQGIDQEEMQYQVALMLENLSEINWFYFLFIILLYFIGGYLLYSSLFAAVGSAVGDDQGEGQQLTIPIAIPIIIALYISIAVATAPDSSLALWSSQFPLFSPIVMPTRLFSNPPLWEVLLSLVLLYATTVGCVWLSARIYRVGILLYGKKASFKEIAKWIFYT